MEENTSRSYSYLSEKRKRETEELKKKLKEQEDARLRRAEKFLTNHPPSRIEAELNEYIIDQPSLTKNVADFLYYHVLRFKYPYLPSRPILICGPSGSGKTEVWRVVKKLYSDIAQITIINSSTITSDGWSGSNKLAHYLSRDASYSILVFDEVDKLCSPRYSVGGVNVSADLQSEFLKVIEENEYAIRSRTDIDYTIKNLGIVFCGAFESIREEKTQPVSQKIGFASQSPKEKKYTGITRSDLLQYGVINELMGRISVVCNTKPMTKEQCFNIVRNSKSRVTDIAGLLESHGIDPWKDLPDEAIIEMIESADIGQFGVRGVLSRIETIMLRSIHEKGLITAPDRKTDNIDTLEDKMTLI